MKTTSISYCQVCTVDFKDGQIVYYVPIDNSIVCRNCAEQAKTDIQPRQVSLKGTN